MSARRARPTRSRAVRSAPVWLPPLVIAPFVALQLIAFRGGVITPDTLFQWSQALSGRYDDWHPPATAWAWRQLMPLGAGATPILLFQLALYWAGAWLIAETLRRRGSRAAMILVLLLAASPISLGQLGAILKDSLLAACCLATLGLAFAARDAFGWRRALAFVTACALLVFASALRFNAALATAPLLLLWLPDRWSDRVSHAVPALAASVALLGGAGWAIDNLALRPSHSRPIFSLVNFDLAGIAAHGGDGYPNLAAAAERGLARRCYSPRQFNPTFRPDCDGAEQALREYADAGSRGAGRIWLEAVKRAPVAYLRHRLDHLAHNLRLTIRDVPDDAIYVMATPPNPFGLAFHANATTGRVLAAARWMAASPLGRPATWLAVALGLLMLAGDLPSRRIIVAAALSALAYGLGYGAVSVAADLRYNLWTMLAAMMGLAIAIAELRGSPIPARRLLFASIPTVLVVAVEVLELI